MPKSGSMMRASSRSTCPSLESRASTCKRYHAACISDITFAWQALLLYQQASMRWSFEGVLPQTLNMQISAAEHRSGAVSCLSRTCDGAKPPQSLPRVAAYQTRSANKSHVAVTTQCFAERGGALQLLEWATSCQPRTLQATKQRVVTRTGGATSEVVAVPARRLLADQRGSSAASCRVHAVSRAATGRGLRCGTAPRAGLSTELLQPCRLATCVASSNNFSSCKGQEHRSAACRKNQHSKSLRSHSVSGEDRPSTHGYRSAMTRCQGSGWLSLQLSITPKLCAGWLRTKWPCARSPLVRACALRCLTLLATGIQDRAPRAGADLVRLCQAAGSPLLVIGGLEDLKLFPLEQAEVYFARKSKDAVCSGQ